MSALRHSGKKFATVLLCLGLVGAGAEAYAHDDSYYRGPLVNASQACFKGGRQALAELRRAAEKGRYQDVRAYAAYWVCKGEPAQAFPWLQKVSDMGSGWSSMVLAHYMSDMPRYRQDVGLREKYLTRAALQGNAWAARELSLLYLNGGEGVKADPQRASYWAQYAEDVTEMVPDTFYLAESYRYGWGVPKNRQKAEHLYKETFRILKRAAANGDPRADMLFYIAYGKGLGVKQDPRKAEYWLKRAAGMGYPEAVAILKEGRIKQ